MNIGGKKVPNWAVYGGIGVLVIGGVLWYRNKSASPGTTASTTGATDPNLIDPTTGVPYADETAGNYAGYNQGISGYGYGFPTSDITGGTTVGTAYTSNAQWAQAVEAGLTALGWDAQAVGAAVGKYLLNMPLTADQVTIVQTAVAEFGPPPVGTFAIIAGGTAPAPPPPGGGTPSGGSGAGGSGGGGVGGSGGGGAGGGTSGPGRLGAPSGAHVRWASGGSGSVGWNPVSGATAYVFELHQGGANGRRVSGPFYVSAPEANFGPHIPKGTLTALIWPSDAADHGGPGSNQPHEQLSFTMH